MKNLVTGATGFIGSHIAQRLKQEGEEVVALVRRTSDIRFLEQLGIELVYGDVTDKTSLQKAFNSIDRVFHAAALVGEWIKWPDARRINVEGTRNLLECAQTANVKQFIYISSLAVLGMHDHHNTPADAPYQKGGDPYIDTKIDAEQLIRQYYQDQKLPVTIIRPGFVFGPREKKLINRILHRLKDGSFAFVGNGKNRMNINYIDNIVDAVMLARDKQVSFGQVYNVGNESGITVEEFIYSIADLWNVPHPKKHIPKWFALLLCNVLESYARLRHAAQPPFITKTRIKFLSLNLDFDNTKTHQHLGYQPRVSVVEGLKKTKEWMDKNG